MPRAIANFFGVDLGLVSRILDPLEAKAVVKHRACEHDKRSVTIMLTAEGSRLIKTLAEVAMAQDEAWLTPLTLEERDVFVSLVGRLLAYQNAPT